MKRLMRRALVLLFSAVVLLAVTLVLCGVALAAYGQPETAIMGSKHYSNQSALAKWSGRDYVVFVNDSHVFFTTDESGSWSMPVIVSGPDMVAYNSWASLVMDSFGHAHIAYATDSSVRYVNNVNGPWSLSEKVALESGYQVCLVLDPANQPVVVYSANGYVKCSRWNSGSWPAPVPVNPGDSSWCASPSLAMDPFGHAHVSYVNGSNAIMYNTDASGAWANPQVQVSESGESGCTSGSIVADPSGHAHVVYTSNWGSQLKYTDNTSGSWPVATSTVSPGDSSFSEPSLTFDGSGNLCLAYGANAPKAVRYTSRVGAVWSSPETAASNADSCDEPSLVMEGTAPRISYTAYSMGNQYGDVMFTKFGGSWSPPANLSSPGQGPQCSNPPAIAYDSAGKAHVVIAGFSGGMLSIIYSDNSAGFWSAPISISDGDPYCMAPAITRDAYGHLYVVYASNKTIRYMDNIAGPWSSPVTVSGPDLGCSYPAIAVDGMGYVHISYYCMGDIHYVDNRPAAGWSPPVKINDSDSSWNSNPPAIVVDSSNECHVVYVQSGSDSLWYTHNSSSDPYTWTAPVIIINRAIEWDIGNLSTCIDNANNIHVVYDSGPFSHEVRYIENSGGIWSTPASITSGNPVDSSIYAGGTSVCADSSNHVYIAYQTSSDIKTMDNVMGPWSTPVTSSGPDGGPRTVSIAMSPPSQKPGIAYGLGYSVQYNGPQHTIFTAPGPGGNIWPSGSVTVNDGQNPSFNIVADSGYRVQDVQVDGNPQGPISYYQFNDVVSDHNINAGFQKTWTVKARVSAGQGSVNPARQTVDDGLDVSVNWAPSAGYRITSITDNGNPVPLVNPYVLHGVATDHSIEVYFEAIPYPAITGISPAQGPIGTSVIVTGSHFGSAQGSSTVTFSGVQAPVTSWSDTRLVVTVPQGASTGPVVVTTSEGVSNGDRQFTVTRPIWYLAEGSTAWGFSTRIAIENPNYEDVNARITYFNPPPAGASGKGIVTAKNVRLPARSQTTIDPSGDLPYQTDFSTTVECLEGKTIAVDRTMTWTGPGAPSPEGHCSVGTDAPSMTWYLPEGSSNWGFETWTLVENPNATDAVVTITYMTAGGGQNSFTRTVKAYSRQSYGMAADMGAVDASVKVTSTVPVIAEESLYRNNRREGSCSIGATSPATAWFLAEGTTAWGFTTYVLIQNPNPEPANVTLTFMTPWGAKQQPAFTMSPGSRQTVRLNDIPAVANTDVSTMVTSDKPVVSERAMYWGAGTPLGEACHASIGFSQPHGTFYLPDGQAGDGCETYTLVQNPNPEAVKVQVCYLTPTGEIDTMFEDEIPARSRKTYNMADVQTGRNAIVVRSLDGTKPVMVERSMYWAHRGAGTNTVGAYED